MRPKPWWVAGHAEPLLFVFLLNPYYIHMSSILYIYHISQNCIPVLSPCSPYFQRSDWFFHWGFLTVPYLQLPLVLDFFASQDRATYLFNPERLGAERGGRGLWWVEHKMGRFTNKYRAKWLRAGLYYQPRPQTSRKIKAFRHWHPATRDVPHFFWNWSLRVVAQATNIHPGGYSDLNLQLNVYFVLAGPCELQLHICKEFDQIPFSKCLKAGFLGRFVLIYACFAYQLFFFWVFSSKGFFVQLSTSSLKQVFLLDPPPLPLLRICPNSSHIPWRNV